MGRLEISDHPTLWLASRHAKRDQQMTQNPLLLVTPLQRANDLLQQHKDQKVIDDKAWAKVVEELVAELKPKEPVTSVDYHPV